MKKLLVLSFFPAFYPPTSGGELRLFNIYNRLSKYYDITILSMTYMEHNYELIEFSDHFREHRVPKADIFYMLHQKIDEQNLCSEISALVCAKSSEYQNDFHFKYLELYQQAEIIIHESPFLLNYDIFFGYDDKLRIYNSYNCETELCMQLWKGSHKKEYVEYIYQLEKELVLNSNVVFATCEEDKSKFIKLFHCDKSKIILAPNGIEPEDYQFEKNFETHTPNEVLFIGSAHPPNIEAAQFIIDELADSCNEIQFFIAGTCCDHINKKNKKNVTLFGKIDQDKKNELFSTSKLAINPMFSGSGTNLKTLEFLSSGFPIVSTEIGMRGIHGEDGKHFILADKSNFASKIKDTIQYSSLLSKLSYNAKEFVNQSFSWEIISNRVRDGIYNIQTNTIFHKICVLIDYEVSSPMAGGEIRANRLFSNLANHYKVFLLCLNEKNLFIKTKINENFIQISVPKSAEHLLEQNTINSKHWVSATDIINSYMCDKNLLLSQISHLCFDCSDIVILSQPFMANLIEEGNKKTIIYDSQNYEIELKKEILKNHPDYNFLLEKCKIIETKAIALSHIIISCSEEERKIYSDISRKDTKLFVVENGVDVFLKSKNYDFSHVKNKFNGHCTVVFIGSGHIPNVEGAQFIVNNLSHKLKNVYFLIIGSVCECFPPDSVSENVLLFGRLDEKVKAALIQLADIAINPIVSGSGSNLKLADYFSNQIPVITTTYGARGYQITNGKEAIICDLDSFEKEIVTMADDQTLQYGLKNNAHQYVLNHLDWRLLGSKYNNIIEMELHEKQKKKILIVTYRLNMPEKGGAEVYLSNIIKEIDPLNQYRIEVAALNIGNLTNMNHFSIDFDYDSNQYADFYKNRTIYKFNIDETNLEDNFKNCRRLQNLWVEESHYFSEKSVHLLEYPILMGGWYFPENQDGSIEIWSSPKAAIFAMNIGSLKLKGFSPTKQIIHIKTDNQEHSNFNVDGFFEISLNDINCNIITINTNSFTTSEDIRELGIKCHEIQYQFQNGQGFEKLSLDFNFKDFIKQKDMDYFVSLLIEIAENREKIYDDLFLTTRGPISYEFENWLNEHIYEYQVVLVHNTPFTTTVTAAEAAKKHHIPYVVLPHYHFTDEFYHWNVYYELFRGAQSVLAFPQVSKEMFFDKICDNSIIISGGGIDVDEYTFIDEEPFHHLYSDSLPFILILGRKSSAKNYLDILDSLDKVNSINKKLNAVMIGPDEDGVNLSQRDVLYFGKQPREVVLGALKNCVAVVNMSESESFGIVILEAWALNRPVIVNENCWAFTELVENMKTGLYANKSNLHEKMIELLNNPLLANEMGKNGIIMLGKNFTWRQISQNILECLEKQMD